jgi:cytochrome b561
MAAFGTRLRYGAVAQIFHWLTAIFVLLAYLLGEGGPPSRVFGPDNATTLSLHESFGVLVVLIVAVRLVWRLADRQPEDNESRRWMLLASRAVHWLLYILLFAVPLTAILGVQFGNHTITAFGASFGPFVGPSQSAGHNLLELHELFGNWILWLAGLHAAAALYHHFFLKDRVLLSMLPWTRS